ncbi:N-acetylmuramoyl-L-alanine amidase [bacterium BMS3Bbin02]|nr:N-acetylmuramoyl-L-alanine amidase [bacterium BMS3Bbin02]
MAGELPALCKAAWGANPNLGTFTPHTIERFTVHHTAAFLKSPGRAPARARQHQKFHLSKGWPDLAYHFLVDSLGNVYEGRPIDAVGDTATSYDPTGHFLIAAEGSFSEQGLPAIQLAGMAELLAWAAVTYNVDPSQMRGHKDWAPETSCPGNAVYAVIADGTLESMMRDAIARGVKQVRVVCTDAAKQYVKDLEATA